MSYLIAKPSENNINEQKIIYDTSTNFANITTSVVDIPGTEISYTPDSNANKVIYEVSLHTFHNPDRNTALNLELFENTGSGYSAMGEYYRATHVNVRVRYELLLNFKFILPAYSGSRSYKLKARSNGSGNESRVNKSSSDETTVIFAPILQMYSVV